MGLNSANVLRAVLLLAGCVWCREVLQRFRKDVAELRGSGDPASKAAIVVIWLTTLALVVWMLGALNTLVSGFVPRI